jgi:hypothetical protein
MRAMLARLQAAQLPRSQSLPLPCQGRASRRRLSVTTCPRSGLFPYDPGLSDALKACPIAKAPTADRVQHSPFPLPAARALRLR